MLALGSLYLAFGDEERAKEPLTKALSLDAEEPMIYANLGTLAARRHEPAVALDHFRMALRRDPGYFPYQVGLAEAYFALDLLDSAEAEYRAILARAPGYIDAHIGLGQVLVSRGDAGDSSQYRAAIVHFSRALALADTMNGTGRDREGSTSLGKSRRAAVLYARGRARICSRRHAQACPMRRSFTARSRILLGPPSWARRKPEWRKSEFANATSRCAWAFSVSRRQR